MGSYHGKKSFETFSHTRSIMEREIVESSEAYVGKSVFPKKINGEEAEAYLLMTFDGDEEEELEDIIEKAAEVALEHEAVDVLIADTPVKKKDAWAARSSFLEAIEADSKLLDECDVVVPVDRIAEYFSFTKKAAEEAGITNKNFGHAHKLLRRCDYNYAVDRYCLEDCQRYISCTGRHVFFTPLILPGKDYIIK